MDSSTNALSFPEFAIRYDRRETFTGMEQGLRTHACLSQGIRHWVIIWWPILWGDSKRKLELNQNSPSEIQFLKRVGANTSRKPTRDDVEISLFLSSMSDYELVPSNYEMCNRNITCVHISSNLSSCKSKALWVTMSSIHLFNMNVITKDRYLHSTKWRNGRIHYYCGEWGLLWLASTNAKWSVPQELQNIPQELWGTLTVVLEFLRNVL